MKVPTFEQLRAYRVANALPWFNAPWDLNLFVMRSEHVGEWDDWLCIACYDDDGYEVLEAIECTSDAWAGEWLDPSHPDGCVYILDQHVPGGYAPGLHKGRLAMRQAAPFRCVRWPAELGRIPLVCELEARGKVHGFSDVRGTHIHNRVSARVPERPARDDSEGCVVVMRSWQMRTVRDLVDKQLRAVGSAHVSPTFGRLRDLQ